MNDSGDKQGALIEGVYKLKEGSRIYYMQANNPAILQAITKWKRNYHD